MIIVKIITSTGDLKLSNLVLVIKDTQILLFHTVGHLVVFPVVPGSVVDCRRTVVYHGAT